MTLDKQDAQRLAAQIKQHEPGWRVEPVRNARTGGWMVEAWERGARGARGESIGSFDSLYGFHYVKASLAATVRHMKATLQHMRYK